MNLAFYFMQSRSAILKRWFNQVADEYPADTSQFLKRQKDPFANPVGSSYKDGMEGLLICLTRIIDDDWPDRELDREEAQKHLDRIMRVRALQKIAPADALRFVPRLKTVIRETLVKELKDGQFDERMAQIDEAIDEMMFLAFETFLACRERLWEIRLKDEQRRVFLLLRRANIICEAQESDVELPDLRDSGHTANHQER